MLFYTRDAGVAPVLVYRHPTWYWYIVGMMPTIPVLT